MEFDPGLDIQLMTSRFDHTVSILGWLSVVTYEYYDRDTGAGVQETFLADTDGQKISFQFRWRYQNIAS